MGFESLCSYSTYIQFPTFSFAICFTLDESFNLINYQFLQLIITPHRTAVSIKYDIPYNILGT